METYKISKIYIENFKLIDKAFIDFIDEDLVVLDGPNGFGKTTMFDAIELVLTGNVSRIENYNKQSGYKTLLFSKDNTKETIIKIEFVSESNTYTFIKRYTPQPQLGKRERRPDNWRLFNTYMLNDFNTDINESKKIEQAEIYDLLGINEDLGRLYELFYYIQQEDNTRFLKQPGKKRMEAINHLFDTHIQQEQLEKISSVRKILMSEKKKVSIEIDQLKNRIELHRGLTSEKARDEVKYAPLLPVNTNTEWDKKAIEIASKEQRDKYIADLIELEDFIENFDEFKKSVFNKGINQIASNKSLLKTIIIADNFIDDYEQIEKQYNREQMLLKTKEKLIRENLMENLKEVNFNNLNKELDLDLNIQDIEQTIKSIIDQQNSASDLSKLVKDLNDTRQKLLTHFKHVLDKTNDKHGECPLCGYDWVNFDALFSEVEEKRKSFSTYYDNATDLLERKIEELYNKHINAILLYINNELEESALVNIDFFEQLKNAMKNKDKIRGFQGWCKENNVDYQSFVNNMYNKAIKDIDDKVEELYEHLSKQKKNVKAGYSESDPKFKQFDNLYQNVFQKSEELVKAIDKEKIERKKKYIDYLFYRYNSKLVELENKNLVGLEELDLKLDTNIEELKDIMDLYDSEIKKHWNQIMTDIEIPFYIYSGKVIQEYQMGLGIFIEESPDGEAKSIKFVSDNNYDHDAINYLSSGQLSALVISFTLALNKVYGNQSLDIILIDDPVQTMDEINIASFTELLRNEFSHKQIIISTHEEDVSRYLRYKFKKYNLNAMKLNVKDHLLMSIN